MLKLLAYIIFLSIILFAIGDAGGSRTHDSGVKDQRLDHLTTAPNILVILFIFSFFFIYIISYFFLNIKNSFITTGLLFSLSKAQKPKPFQVFLFLSLLYIYYIINFLKNQKFYFGADDGVRTRDTRLKRAMLFHLSYIRIFR